MDFTSALGLIRSLYVYRCNPAAARRLRKLYATLVGPGDLAFDVGSHVGDRIAALRVAGARVVAVEPNALLYAFLRKLYGKAPDVTLENCALGAGCGSAELRICAWNPSVASLSPQWIEITGATPGFTHITWNRGETVKVETLDALIARHGAPRFVKVDVEGFEAEVLQGLTTPVPTLSFEFLTGRSDLVRQCLTLIERLGNYRFNLSYAESFAFASPQWMNAAALMQAMVSAPAQVRSGDIYAQLA